MHQVAANVVEQNLKTQENEFFSWIHRDNFQQFYLGVLAPKMPPVMALIINSTTLIMS